jgi:phosphoribosylamine--glycine ligase / phosphoribosylformylglycinamidine cyclo-ligase
MLIGEKVSLVVPGPEQPLVDGVEAYFRKGIMLHSQFNLEFRCTLLLVGIPVFGPSALAARMEGSKAFAKAFMARHSIPTAKFQTFKSHQVDEAIQYVKSCNHKVVLKASGLAGGKGVLIPETTEEAISGLDEIMVANAFGEAGKCSLFVVNTEYLREILTGSEVVVEELLLGPEISVLAFSDGYTIVPLPAAQDHKRIGDGDVGLNTGGMGAYAPAPIASPAVMDQIAREVLRPTIDGMRKEGRLCISIFTTLLLKGFQDSHS